MEAGLQHGFQKVLGPGKIGVSPKEVAWLREVDAVPPLLSQGPWTASKVTQSLQAVLLGA